MRCYALIISDGLTAGIGLTNFLGKGKNTKSGSLILTQNCFGSNDSIAIDFDLQFVNDKSIVDKHITLYNVNRYWHGKLAQDSLKDKRIILYAGVKLTPTLTRQNAYNNKYKSCYIINDFQLIEQPLFDGYISNAYTEVENGTTALTLTVLETAKASSSFSINSIISSPLKIPSGTVWFPLVKGWIVKYYLKKLAIPPIIKKGKITQTTSKSDINVDNIKGIKDNDSGLSLQSILNESFGCDIVITNNGTIIIQNAEGKKEEENTSFTTNIISDNELLTQPHLVDATDKRIMITLPLTNRFNFQKNNMFTLITKSATIFNQIETIGDSVVRADLSINEIGKYWEGVYKIVQIWHTGSSRNSDVNAWVTKIEATKTDNKIDNIKEILKNIYKKSWLN